jgi:pSer/pThr/pTyr-binding forkhead associated (FHA) protein
MGKLVHFHADGTAVEIKLDRQRITIGRRPDNDFCLPYPAVSGEHAAVVTILSDSFLEDLGSTNGTLVNGTAVAKHFLRDRDQIDVGQQILVYLVDDGATLEPPPGAKASPEGSRQRESAEGTLVVPAPLRAKRRSDWVAPAPAPSADIDDRSAEPAIEDGAVAVAVEAATAPTAMAQPEAAATVTPAPERKTAVEPALKVVSGAKAGRIVALVKDETLIGRAGVQVVALRRAEHEVRVVPVEGARPPRVNGMQVVPEGRPLSVGDILEVAGTKLEVIAAVDPTSV